MSEEQPETDYSSYEAAFAALDLRKDVHEAGTTLVYNLIMDWLADPSSGHTKSTMNLAKSIENLHGMYVVSILEMFKGAPMSVLKAPPSRASVLLNRISWALAGALAATTAAIVILAVS